MIIFACICGLGLMWLGVWAAYRRDLRAEAIAKRNKAQQVILDALRSPDFNAPADHQIEAWTPQEREAFGVNDTVRLIDRIDRELKQIEVDRTFRDGRKGWTEEQRRAFDEEPTVVSIYSWGSPEPVATYHSGGIV